MSNPSQGPTWPEYMHTKLQSDWVLSPTCRANCECYFLRHWEYEYFLDKLKIPAALEYNGITYEVVYTGDYLIHNGLCKQVALSFRAPAPELNLPAYVLVKGISQ